MKNLILVTVALASFNSFAMNRQEFSPDSNINIQNYCDDHVHNVDGSYTIKNPRLVRGNKNFAFGWTTDKTGVCKAMGFDSYLPQSEQAAANDGAKAYMDGEGNFGQLSANGSYAISNITCFNGNYLTHGSGEISQNPDKTFTIAHPSLVRGDKSFAFGWSTDKNGVCRAMGFESSLSQSETATANDGAKAYIDANGSYSQLSSNGTYAISEITCVNGKNLTLVVDQNGKEYFKRREPRN